MARKTKVTSPKTAQLSASQVQRLAETRVRASGDPQGLLAAPNAFAAVDEAEAIREESLGFKRIQGIDGSTFRDNKTVVLVPTRGAIHWRVVSAWQTLMAPMNQWRPWLYAVGDEVGVAYNRLIEQILVQPQLSTCKYVLTLEDDNVPPPDAHIRLLETIEAYNFDAVSGIYFTKGDWNMPMAYGDPAVYERTGKLEFEPRDVRSPLRDGRVMEVNGIAMGCALWRMDLFRQIAAPWFVTACDVTSAGAMSMTQDLYFCRRAREAGKRFAVDFRVAVGHLDIHTGQMY